MNTIPITNTTLQIWRVVQPFPEGDSMRIWEGIINVKMHQDGNDYVYDVTNIKRKKKVQSISRSSKATENHTTAPSNQKVAQADSKVNKKGVKLQIADEDVVDTGNPDLVAIHNLTPEKLQGVIDLNGFAMPSIAIKKDTIGTASNEGYGRISVVQIRPSKFGGSFNAIIDMQYVDSNFIKSMYGRRKAENYFEGINKDEVLFIDQKKSLQLMSRLGLQLSAPLKSLSSNTILRQSKNIVNIKDKDSAGKKLTDGQKSYFRDSKVTDDRGRLKVMYHGSPNGGFTTFKNHLNFFTADKQYAEEYTHKTNTTLQIWRVVQQRRFVLWCKSEQSDLYRSKKEPGNHEATWTAIVLTSHEP